MIKNLIVLLTVFIATNIFAQDHNSDTSFVINKQTFRFKTKDINAEKVTLTIYRDSKIIQTDSLDSGGLAEPKFIDFDKDGNSDIILTFMGNNFTYYLYLFDSANNKFKFVEGFERFPEASQLDTNSKYYYSYHRAGCADMNWVSDLFYIANYKTIHIGHIYGKGCTSEVKENPQTIEIYKVYDNNGNNRKLTENLPYMENLPDFRDKWDFIKKYWNENYSKFK